MLIGFFTLSWRKPHQKLACFYEISLNEIKNNSVTDNVAHGQQMYAMKSNGTTNDSFCCIILMNY